MAAPDSSREGKRPEQGTCCPGESVLPRTCSGLQGPWGGTSVLDLPSCVQSRPGWTPILQLPPPALCPGTAPHPSECAPCPQTPSCSFLLFSLICYGQPSLSPVLSSAVSPRVTLVPCALNLRSWFGCPRMSVSVSYRLFHRQVLILYCFSRGYLEGLMATPGHQSPLALKPKGKSRRQLFVK